MNKFLLSKRIIRFFLLVVLSGGCLQVAALNLEDVYSIAENSDPQFKQVAAAKRAILERRKA